MKKVLLVGDSPISMSPYISSYIEVFDRNNIPYELVYWNKTMEDVTKLPESFVPYNHAHNNVMAGWKKLFKINGFARFAKQRMKKYDYSFVVVFTIAHALFLYNYLIKYYKNNYIFDIRDFSPLCNIPLCKNMVKKLMDNSVFTVISSRGFLRWLPKVTSSKVVLSHNMLLRALNLSQIDTMGRDRKELKILTIGQIAYYESQQFFIQQLSNNGDYSMLFAGSGPAVPQLEDYVKCHCINNVEFSGRYDKSEEPAIVNKADLINIWLKSDINADSCMANRFYLSVLFRKPMIVHKGSYMAELCAKYNLGIVLEEGDDFGAAIKEWTKNHNHDVYMKGCIDYLYGVKQDILTFENKLIALC